MPEGDCLLARAISLPPKEKAQSDRQIDSLSAQLGATSISLSADKKKGDEGKVPKQRRQRPEQVSPADHLTLQSMRSSALARKTNTTAKFSRDCRNLFADLMLDEHKGKQKAEEKKEESGKEEEKKGAEERKEGNECPKEESVEEKDQKEGNCEARADEKKKDDGASAQPSVELLARGPIRGHFVGHAGNQAQSFHPYSANLGAAAEAPAAPQSAILDQSSLNPAYGYGYGYECGLPSNWSCGGWSGRDSVLSSPSSTPDTAARLVSPPGAQAHSELPDDLSDFILEYSRRYSPTLGRRKQSFSEDSPRSTTDDSLAHSSCGGESPLSAPQSSPAAPRGGMVGGTRSPPVSLAMTKQGSMERPAKDRLRALIRSEDMDDAWAWTCKCIQRHPGALTFQDADRDTLLHIVTQHLDLAKIYALVEQMLKFERTAGPGDPLPFDVPNGVGETPLMVAVQKRQAEVVDYLLEAGTSPNAQSTRMERDMPLHYAATRGMADIVRILCAQPRTGLNVQNGMGLTSLLCAFKSHGMLEEESQKTVDSTEVVSLLLKAGADPTIADATNGRTLVHYAVERTDERLIELLRANMDDQRLGQLVNQRDFCGENPMRTLECLENLEEQQRSRLCLALITCGADASGAK